MKLLRAALSGIRARRGASLLAGLGVMAAAVVVGTAVTVSYSLTTGFDRAADQADLPHLLARFEPEAQETVDERVRALPNLAARAYRLEVNDIELRAGSDFTPKGTVHVVLDPPRALATPGGARSSPDPGRSTDLGGGDAGGSDPGDGRRAGDDLTLDRRGYAIVAGRDLTRGDEVVIEQGLARAWSLQPGDSLEVGRLGVLRVAGISVSPDNVAYPLAKAARVYVSEQFLRDSFGPGEAEANVALLWLNDPERADITLAQARVVSFGIGRLRFVTREGVRILLDQAAGIVLSLLVAFSLVALVAAATMLGAGAQAQVHRRMVAFGVQRALGYTPGQIAGQQAAEAALVAVPAAALGLAIGAVAVTGPTDDLLAALNQRPPGAALLLPLAGALGLVVVAVVASATWPAWRAARRSPASILRGGDVADGRRRGLRIRPRRAAAAGGSARGEAPTDADGGSGAASAAGVVGRTSAGTGLIAVGARMALATRARWLAAVSTVGVCAGVVLLMLALAALLERLSEDPGTLGKRYDLTVKAGPERLPAVRAVPGVRAADERYVTQAAVSYRLGESVRLVAFGGDHTAYEAPPLASGRRIRAPGELEVGAGLADALGLRPGSVLAVQTPSGRELRLRVVGVVRALEADGRLGYISAPDLLRAEPRVEETLAVRLAPGADRDEASRALARVGAPAEQVGGVTTSNAGFLLILAAVLRGVGVAVGLVCLYALVEALAMTARERRGAVAVLRSAGADALTIAQLFAGAALAVAVPAAALAVILERWLFAPLVASLAADFAALALDASPGQVAAVVSGLLILAAISTALVARRAMTEPIITGLREP